MEAGDLPAPTVDEQGRTIYKTGRLDKPLEFFAYFVADRPGAYVDRAVETTVAGIPVGLTIRHWKEDTAWGKRVGGLFERGLPQLSERIGLPWPRDEGLVVQESHAGPSRRELFVVSCVMSASIVVAVSVVPSIVMAPVTAGVRPTAVVDPMPASSSATRNPTKLPVESSKLNWPTLSSTAHAPDTPLGDAAAVDDDAAGLDDDTSLDDGTPLDDAAGVAVVCTAPTAASRLTAAGASSRRRNHQIPAPASTTTSNAPASTHFNHDRFRGGDAFGNVDVFVHCLLLGREYGDEDGRDLAHSFLEFGENRSSAVRRTKHVLGRLTDLPVAVAERELAARRRPSSPSNGAKRQDGPSPDGRLVGATVQDRRQVLARSPIAPSAATHASRTSASCAETPRSMSVASTSSSTSILLAACPRRGLDDRVVGVVRATAAATRWDVVPAIIAARRRTDGAGSTNAASRSASVKTSKAQQRAKRQLPCHRVAVGQRARAQSAASPRVPGHVPSRASARSLLQHVRQRDHDPRGAERR